MDDPRLAPVVGVITPKLSAKSNKSEAIKQERQTERNSRKPNRKQRRNDESRRKKRF